jgi:hypothetical protein
MKTRLKQWWCQWFHQYQQKVHIKTPKTKDTTTYVVGNPGHSVFYRHTYMKDNISHTNNNNISHTNNNKKPTEILFHSERPHTIIKEWHRKHGQYKRSVNDCN